MELGTTDKQRRHEDYLIKLAKSQRILGDFIGSADFLRRKLQERMDGGDNDAVPS